MKLKDAISDPTAKKLIVYVKVIKKISDISYIVGDNTEIIHMTTTGVNLNESDSISIIKPKFEKNQLITTIKPQKEKENFKLILSKKAKLKIKEIEERINLAPTSTQLLKDVGKLKANMIVPDILLKVVHIPYIQTVKQSSTVVGPKKIITVKDKSGDINRISLFQEVLVECGKIYLFSRLQVNGVKKIKNERYLRLRTRTETRIKPCTSNDQMHFNSVFLGDGILKGKILAVFLGHQFLACPECRTSIPEDQYFCSLCHKIIKKENRNWDFDFKLIIKTEEDKKICYGYKRHIGKILFSGERSSESIQEKLNKICIGKEVSIDYYHDQIEDKENILLLNFIVI